MLSKLIKKITPPSLQFKLVSLKHTFTKFRQTYYSQNGEDIILKSMFPKEYRGFYVDVGAHHPYRISNTYLLHLQGWSGINIDANPDTINLFNQARPGDINIQLGVAKLETELTYHMFKDPAVNTFSDTEAERWKKKTWNDYLGTTNVPVSRLGKILKDNLSNGRAIDLLSIDVEGLDLEVLQSNDWNAYKPKVVIVESHTFSIENKDKNELYSFLKEKGYELKHVVKFSLIFTLKSE